MNRFSSALYRQPIYPIAPEPIIRKLRTESDDISTPGKPLPSTFPADKPYSRRRRWYWSRLFLKRQCCPRSACKQFLSSVRMQTILVGFFVGFVSVGNRSIRQRPTADSVAPLPYRSVCRCPSSPAVSDRSSPGGHPASGGSTVGADKTDAVNIHGREGVSLCVTMVATDTHGSCMGSIRDGDR